MKDMNAAYALCSGNLHTGMNSLGPNSLTVFQWLAVHLSIQKLLMIVKLLTVEVYGTSRTVQTANLWLNTIPI